MRKASKQFMQGLVEVPRQSFNLNQGLVEWNC